MSIAKEYSNFKKNFAGPKLPRGISKKRLVGIYSKDSKICNLNWPEPKQNLRQINPDSRYGKMTPDQRGSHVARVILRSRKIKQATPKWANLEEIKKIYIEAQIKSEVTGINYEVDHIIPISHPLVCGLHVENNLSVITERNNQAKSNKFNIE